MKLTEKDIGLDKGLFFYCTRFILRKCKKKKKNFRAYKHELTFVKSNRKEEGKKIFFDFKKIFFFNFSEKKIPKIANNVAFLIEYMVISGYFSLFMMGRNVICKFEKVRKGENTNALAIFTRAIKAETRPYKTFKLNQTGN